MSRTLLWNTEDDTRHCAGALAQCPAVGNAFIALHGELGAGKTSFVRHLLRALDVSGSIKSPTYAVVEPHRGHAPRRDSLHSHALDIWHFDFYRFDDPREWEDAGFRELFASPGLKLAEWPEKAAAVLPTADLDITLSVRDDETRQVGLQPHTATGRALAEAMASAVPPAQGHPR